MKSMKPSQIAGLYFLVIAILAFFSLVVPEGGIHLDLQWPTMSEMLELEADTTAYDPDEPLASVDTVAPVAIKSDVVDTITDTRYYLSSFYRSLDSTRTKAVRVVHYGDSQIEEDRMSMTLRRDLQSRFGGGGVGLLPLHQTIAMRTVTQGLYINGVRQTAKQGPRRHMVYGPRDFRRSDGLYGVMGQVATMDNSLVSGSERIEVRVSSGSDSTATERFFTRARLVADPGITMTAKGQTVHSQQLITLPDSTRSVSLAFAGKGKVYGFSLETPTGVMVDNIPMRGCAGAVFTSMNRQQCADYYKATNTRLIILQFGGNAIGSNSHATISHFVEQLRKQVQMMKECAPEASILFIGPSDMLVRRGGKSQSNEGVAYMDRKLLRMAQEERIGYFSLYHAMGGRNSMLTWQNQNLAGNDGIHFTPNGAVKAATLLAQWLEKGRQMTKGNKGRL